MSSVDHVRVGDACPDCGCRVTATVTTTASLHVAGCGRADAPSLRARIGVLERHLLYAIDALEGRPATGWNTDSARDVIEGRTA